VLRIHFGDADLRRTRFADRPEPLWDTALGVHALSRDVRVPASARSWRAQMRSRLHPGMRPMFTLYSRHGLFPDFLVPDVSGLRDGLQAVRETPAERMQTELAPFLPADRLNGYPGDLLAGSARARRDLGAAVRLVHETMIAPVSGAIERRLAADVAFRSHLLLEDGLDATLGSLHPDLTWTAPVLTTRPHGDEGLVTDIHLDGRGLLLYPTGFTTCSLIVDQPGRTPLLFYPALESRYDVRPDPAALAELLGRTRAEVLVALAAGASTSQLARRTGISAASASEHARVLRRSGLVESHRYGKSTLHTLTPLGRRLLATA
jgi:DNA-binding transcriptional ArsR family regulator